jgi:opine dehydrogenase
VPTPTIDSLIHLASIINGIDYFETGRTADKIGIGKMDAADVNRFLADGY